MSIRCFFARLFLGQLPDAAILREQLAEARGLCESLKDQLDDARSTIKSQKDRLEALESKLGIREMEIRELSALAGNRLAFIESGAVSHREQDQ